MFDTSDDRPWFTENHALLALVTVTVLLALVVILPYLQYILISVVLAYALTPVQVWLEQYVRPAVGAGTLCATVLLTVLVPSAYLLLLALQQGLAVLRFVRRGVVEEQAIEERMDSFGLPVDLDVLYATYQEPITGALQSLANTAIGTVRTLPDVFIGLTVMFFVLFALLRDRGLLLAWARAILPLNEEYEREFIQELDELMWASVIGNATVAAIQAGLIAAGLLLLGIDNVIFYSVATFVLALLPLVGAFVVWVPLSGIVLATGRPIAASLLIVWGSVVSVSDFYLRPAVIGHSGALGSATVVVGIFGGVVAFGPVGLFVGPVILGGAKLAVEFLAREGTLTDSEIPNLEG